MAAGSDASELSFVDHFNRVMSNIATPTRLMFPWLDTLFPRQAVIDDVDALNARYDGLLQEKRGKPGRDILSYLLEDASLSNEELRSNLSILFSAGHVSSISKQAFIRALTFARRTPLRARFLRRCTTSPVIPPSRPSYAQRSCPSSERATPPSMI